MLSGFNSTYGRALIYSQAKARKVNLWRGHVSKAPQTSSSFDAVVLKIVNGDTIEVSPKQETTRRTIQFSSVRQPKQPSTHDEANLRTNDPKQAAWQIEVREYLRKRIIGKTVNSSRFGVLTTGPRPN
jgi:staphylococcal nuclease domain-containing protein 1